MTLDEILKEYYYCGETKTIEKEKQAILSWFKEQLPKEQEESDFSEHYIHRWQQGYNQCLKDTLTNLTAKQGER